jgi:hypothetical protein
MLRWLVALAAAAARAYDVYTRFASRFDSAEQDPQDRGLGK